MSGLADTVTRREPVSERDAEQRRRIVETAGRLYREIGFQKTTVADIARELRMSPANVYRFFGSKAEINAACAEHLLGEVESALTRLVEGPGSASDRLRALVKTNEAMNAERFLAERKLHEMVEFALNENWPIIDEHVLKLRALTRRVIDDGVKSGEFAAIDPELGAALLQSATICYCHPRMMVECNGKPVPSSDQMIDFCLRALRGGRDD